MTKQEVLKLIKYFKSNDMKILQICLLLDVVFVRLPNGTPKTFYLKNFR